MEENGGELVGWREVRGEKSGVFGREGVREWRSERVAGVGAIWK